MISAILILLAMPFTDLSKYRGIQFRPLSKIAFYVFIANFLILMQLGAKHVESPFIEFGQISTVLYFAHYLIIVPCVSLLENSFIEYYTNIAATSGASQKEGVSKVLPLKPLSFINISKGNFSSSTKFNGERVASHEEVNSDGFNLSVLKTNVSL
jgi:ubiquinol-cytochrome c reductase cytochrome b subunit